MQGKKGERRSEGISGSVAGGDSLPKEDEERSKSFRDVSSIEKSEM